MMRQRRGPLSKTFVAGGVYDGSQQQQQSTPQKPRALNQSTQQQSAQQQPAAPQQQAKVAPQPKQQQQPQQQQQQQPQQQQQQPQVKHEETDAAATPMVEDGLVENGKPIFKKIFLSRKKASVRAKEKRIRQNRQLRKAILPKNALMALNEVKGITISDYNIVSNKNGGFTAMVTVNGNPYEGNGNSKIAAKNRACEMALRDYVIAKMIQKPRVVKQKTSISEGGEAMDTAETNGDSDGGESQKADDADDVPMVNLASFALYKLFSEWEKEGFVIPEMHAAQSANASSEGEGGEAAAKEPKKPPIRNELPVNWEAMHPATLLCVMRPGLTYTYYGTVGEKPNEMQQLGVVVDDQEFHAEGRSKKIARRNVAVKVCNQLFGTTFAEETIEATA